MYVKGAWLGVSCMLMVHLRLKWRSCSFCNIRITTYSLDVRRLRRKVMCMTENRLQFIILLILQSMRNDDPVNRVLTINCMR